MNFLPRTRFGLMWRAFIAAILVVGFTAGAVATAGLLQVGHLAQELGVNAQNVAGLTLPAEGRPETLLLIGSDHRGAQFEDYAQSDTDTMLLIRIDDSSSTINVMSVPRDLDVLGPGDTPVKLNSIYSSEGGPAGLIKVLKQQVFPGFQVNHVIDTSFIGFSDLIDAIGCVYTDVDHRYYNVSQPAPSPYNYSSIDLQPGYQRLCGGVHTTNGAGALAFVRFRHTDSDEVRNARQQDFIRWARDGYSAGDLLHNQGKLTQIFAKYTHTDKSLASTAGLIDLFDLVVNANSHSLRTIPFPEYFGANIAGQASYVYPCPELSTCSGYAGPNPTLGQPTQATEAAWKEFITPSRIKPASAKKAVSTSKKKKVKASAVNLAGLEADPGDGISQSGQLRSAGLTQKLPIFYPKYIVPSGAGLADTYCFTITDDCNQGYEPEAAFKGSYPRSYDIYAAPGRTAYPSYVMTLQINRALGEYYTIQGTTWKNPPILNKPSRGVHLDGKTLLVYDDGSKIADVAFKTARGTYWISNSLDNAISNSAMLAMGAEMTEYVHKP